MGSLRASLSPSSPARALGKTHLAYHWGILLARRGLRGLIIDRDNPRSEIPRRQKRWGAAGLGDKLKIVTREQAPPLTDKVAWAKFPYDDFDFVILDSISAATQGVEEKDGGKAGAGLAPLVDAVRRRPCGVATREHHQRRFEGQRTLGVRWDCAHTNRCVLAPVDRCAALNPPSQLPPVLHVQGAAISRRGDAIDFETNVPLELLGAEGPSMRCTGSVPVAGKGLRDHWVLRKRPPARRKPAAWKA